MGTYKQDNCAFTALDKDLFSPLGLYAGEDGKPIIFGLGCTLAVTPYMSDFIGRIKPMQKTMNDLGATAKVVGEGTVMWCFKDDYGVTKRVKVKAYHIPVSKVIQFSP